MRLVLRAAGRKKATLGTVGVKETQLPVAGLTSDGRGWWPAMGAVANGQHLPALAGDQGTDIPNSWPPGRLLAYL